MMIRIFIVLLFFSLGCSNSKSISNNNSTSQVGFRFNNWQEKSISDINDQYESLTSDDQRTYKVYFENMRNGIRLKEEASFLSMLKESEKRLSISQVEDFYILEYFLQGESSELKYGFISKLQNTCTSLIDDDKWRESRSIECHKLEDILSMKSSWKNELKALNSYLHITQINNDNIILTRSVLNLSVWQIRIADNFFQ